jgi:isopenicillin N synthase-like dioxygenase
MCLPPAPSATCIELVPGHFVDQATWGKLDSTLKAAQDQVTRLTAENASFRATASSWQPGWKTLAGAVLTGIAAGLYFDRKL